MLATAQPRAAGGTGVVVGVSGATVVVAPGGGGRTLAGAVVGVVVLGAGRAGAVSPARGRAIIGTQPRPSSLTSAQAKASRLVRR